MGPEQIPEGGWEGRRKPCLCGGSGSTDQAPGAGAPGAAHPVGPAQGLLTPLPSRVMSGLDPGSQSCCCVRGVRAAAQGGWRGLPGDSGESRASRQAGVVGAL